jgi:hypothetical protein
VDAFADLMGAVEFRPELAVPCFPVRAETLVEIAAELID